MCLPEAGYNVLYGLTHVQPMPVLRLPVTHRTQPVMAEKPAGLTHTARGFAHGRP